MLAVSLGFGIQARAQAPSSLWVKTYNGPARRGDFGNACALDRSGNLYVTGMSQHPYSGGDELTIKFNTSNGDTIWTSRNSVWSGLPNDTSHDRSGNACVVDNSGNLYVAGWDYGPEGYSVLLNKYNPSTGSVTWSKTYNSGKDDYANGCAIDQSGSIYTVGTTDYSGDNDFLVMKYNASGDALWSRRYDGTAHSDDQALGCAVDNAGNLYVAGYSYTGTNYTLMTIKYNSSGDTLWTRRSSDVLDTLVHPSAGCAVDSAGNVYITGMCGVQSGYGNRYSVTIKYNSSGTVLWTSRYDSPSIYDQTIACAVDSKNDLYAVGTTYDPLNRASFNGNDGDNWLIIKYNSSNGDTLWTIKRYGSNGSDYATGCTLDASGNLYIAGLTNFYGADTTGDYLVAKLQSTVTAVGGPTRDLPKSFSLSQNYPNPFNPTTTINYQLATNSHVTLKVYDLLGREVATLVNENQTAGYKSATFDPHSLSSGVYFYRFEAGDYREAKKLILLK